MALKEYYSTFGVGKVPSYKLKNELLANLYKQPKIKAYRVLNSNPSSLV